MATSYTSVRTNLYKLSTKPTIFKYSITIYAPRSSATKAVTNIHEEEDARLQHHDSYKQKVFKLLKKQYDVLLPTKMFVYIESQKSAYSLSNEPTAEGVHPVNVRDGNCIVDVRVGKGMALDEEEGKNLGYVDGLVGLIGSYLNEEDSGSWFKKTLQFHSSIDSELSNNTSEDHDDFGSMRSRSSSVIIELNNNGATCPPSNKMLGKLKSRAVTKGSRNPTFNNRLRIIRGTNDVMLSLPHKYRPSPTLSMANGHSSASSSSTSLPKNRQQQRFPPNPPWNTNGTNAHRSFPYRLSSLVRQLPSFYHHTHHNITQHNHQPPCSATFSSDLNSHLNNSRRPSNVSTSNGSTSNLLRGDCSELLNLDLHSVTVDACILPTIRGNYLNIDEDRDMNFIQKGKTTLSDGWVCIADSSIPETVGKSKVDGIIRSLKAHGYDDDQVLQPMIHCMAISDSIPIIREIHDNYANIKRLRKLSSVGLNAVVILAADDVHDGNIKDYGEVARFGDVELGIPIIITAVGDCFDLTAHRINASLGGWNLLMSLCPDNNQRVDGFGFHMPCIVLGICLRENVISIVGFDRQSGRRCHASVKNGKMNEAISAICDGIDTRPTSVAIFRDVTYGNEKVNANSEMQLFKQIVKARHDCQFTYITVRDYEHHHLKVISRATDMPCRDGLLITDDRICHSVKKEFYLLSDSWTGSPSLYQIVYDDFKLPFHQLTTWLYGLCVNQLGRRPAPVVACVQEARALSRRVWSYANGGEVRERGGDEEVGEDEERDEDEDDEGFEGNCGGNGHGSRGSVVNFHRNLRHCLFFL